MYISVLLVLNRLNGNLAYMFTLSVSLCVYLVFNCNRFYIIIIIRCPSPNTNPDGMQSRFVWVSFRRE